MTLEREILFLMDISAPVDRVWQAIVDPDEIPRWNYMDKIEVGQDPDSVVHHLVSANGTRDLAEILAAEQNRSLVYRWTSSEPMPTIVEYDLEPNGDTITRLRFRNRGYLEGPDWDKYYEANYRGWIDLHLALKRYVEVPSIDP